jgi:hypothetical protein
MASYVGILPSAARVAAVDTPIVVNYNDARAGYFYVDITGTSSITVAVKGSDPVSGKTHTIVLSPILSANGTTILKVGPGLTAAANSVVNDYLATNWFVSVSGAGTYSIGASII